MIHKTIALYARVSTENQTTENQEILLKQWAESKARPYTLYTEVASGAKHTREQLGEMMSAIRRGEHDIVVVWKLDRLGRSLQHLLQIIEELRNRKVQFVTLTEMIDTESPQGRLFLQIAGAFAEFERALIRERVILGIDRARKEGKTLGRPKGSPDKKQRRKAGYWLRYAKKGTPLKIDP